MGTYPRNLTLETKWRTLLAQQPGSGLTVRAFCESQQVSRGGFYAWRRCLRLRDQEKISASLSRSSQNSTPAFVPVVVDAVACTGSDSAANHVVLELRGGRVLRLPSAWSVARVAELVLAVEGAGNAGGAL